MTSPADTPSAAEMPCLICAAVDGIVTPIARIGMFYPISDEAKQAVLILRQRPVQPGTQPGLAYGLCSAHASTPVQEIEATIIATSKQAGTI